MEALDQCFHQVKQTEKPSVKNLFWSIGYNKKKIEGRGGGRAFGRKYKEQF
jgi:hypothetical protein